MKNSGGRTALGLAREMNHTLSPFHFLLEDSLAVFPIPGRRSPPFYVKLQMFDAGGIRAHGNQRSEWAAGCRSDNPNPEYR